MAPKKEVVLVVTEEEQFKNLIETEKRLIVVDLFTKWCGPCTAIVPTMKSLQVNMDSFDERVLFVQLEREVVQSLATTYPSTSKPRFLFFRDSEIKKQIESCDAPAIIRAIEELALSLTPPAEEN